VSDTPRAGTTAFLLHPSSALHDTGWGHPEHQGRLRALASTVGRDMIALHGRAEQMEPGEATVEDLLRVHTEAHVDRIRDAVDEAKRAAEASGTGPEAARPGPGDAFGPDPSTPNQALVALDPDTRVSPASWDAALGSVGAVLAAADAVTADVGAVGEAPRADHAPAARRARNAFVATRPPGHHATPDRAMGFCLFNHVAVAARWLQAKGRAERVLIVDWDVHHGNGTQDVFEEDPSVFFLSLHQFPHWPGSGRESEVGVGEGRGFTRNVEIRPGLPRERYLEQYDAALDDVFERFEPDAALVSSGFDCLAGDPLGGLLLEPEDLHAMTRRLLAWADGACEGRVVITLEGGYDPARTGQGAVAVIRALAGVPYEG